ncbi:MAG: BON domain-containing protein [Bdellovibrionaceae bacterium]|nr:BON domain-containing protein [Bdellovibrio sp.]
MNLKSVSFFAGALLAAQLLLFSVEVQAARTHTFSVQPQNQLVRPEKPAPRGDNSAINDRDKYLSEYTADQQGKTKEDTELTRRIRREIMRDKSLSIYAHNIKIITMHGQVTLKGPVRSAEEAKNIIKKAQEIAGASSVLNQIDIAAK